MATAINKTFSFDVNLGKGIILNIKMRIKLAHPTLHADMIRRDTIRPDFNASQATDKSGNY
mgnify:CR=1 FL=1